MMISTGSPSLRIAKTLGVSETTVRRDVGAPNGAPPDLDVTPVETTRCADPLLDGAPEDRENTEQTDDTGAPNSAPTSFSTIVIAKGLHDLGYQVGRHGIGQPVIVLVPARRKKLLLNEREFFTYGGFQETSRPEGVGCQLKRTSAFPRRVRRIPNVNHASGVNGNRSGR